MNLRVLVLAGATAFVASLLLARIHPFGDAGLYAQTSPTQRTSLPPEVGTILFTKCADCHSNQTHAPIYGRFAPVSWFMERDIVAGRKHFNFSIWDSYPPEERQVLQAKIIQQTKLLQMPLPQYRAIHRGSAITSAELKVLTEWAHSANPAEESSTQTESSVAAGKAVFEKRCTGCHSLNENREGPKLSGVFGKAAGSVTNFAYSAALKDAHISWDEATLERWLTDPDAFVPGNDMDFRVAKPQERANLIRFFKESVQR